MSALATRYPAKQNPGLPAVRGVAPLFLKSRQ
jgi:hypothetical protein